MLGVSIIYIQYLLKRYNKSQWTQLAVATLTEKADGVFNHRYCPGALGMAYSKFKGLMARMASGMR